LPEHLPPSRVDGLPASVSAPLAAIEEHLARALRGAEIPTSLRHAMEYATLGGGKRLRPLLAWHACAAAGGRGEASLPACAALELVHCFSLVHDDLPALDDDDLRRGRPTLHVHAGEATAILAGDALLTHAFKLLAEAPLPAAVVVHALIELSVACERMISGQVLDTIGFDAEPDAVMLSTEARLEAIHHGKTGAMLVASVRLGAACAPACEPGVLAGLTLFGEAVGLMFQVVDDLLDVTQRPEHTGKRTGKDAGAGKLTYPGVLGIDRSRALVATLEARALTEISDLGEAAGPLRDLCRYLARRTR
jgi:geranylgeranyl diphosphate synthase, type II